MDIICISSNNILLRIRLILLKTVIILSLLLKHTVIDIAQVGIGTLKEANETFIKQGEFYHVFIPSTIIVDLVHVSIFSIDTFRRK